MLVPLAAVDPVIGVVLVALISPIGAYIMAARRMSGKIATSDAEQLWAESKAIRDWSAERLRAADNEIAELRKRVDRLWRRIRELEDRNLELEDELEAAHNRIFELEGTNQ